MYVWNENKRCFCFYKDMKYLFVNKSTIDSKQEEYNLLQFWLDRPISSANKSLSEKLSVEFALKNALFRLTSRDGLKHKIWHKKELDFWCGLTLGRNVQFPPIKYFLIRYALVFLQSHTPISIGMFHHLNQAYLQ